MVRLIRLWSALLLFVLVSSQFCHAQIKPIVFQQQPDWRQPLDISGSTYYFEDTSEDGLPIEIIQRQKFEPFTLRKNDRVTGLEKSVKTTWMTFRIQNESKTDTLELLYYCNSHTIIDAYRDTTFIARTGFAVGVDDRHPIPIHVPPGQTYTYWVRVVNHYMSIMILISELSTHEAYLQGANAELVHAIPLFLILSIMCGCALFMGAYAFYHYYLNRDKVFLYYGIFSLLLFYSLLSGVSNRFGISDVLNRYSFTYLLFIPYALFISKVVGFEEKEPIVSKILKVLMAVCFVQQVLLVIEREIMGRPIFPFAWIYEWSLIPGILVALVCLLYVIKSESPIKGYISLGITLMIVVGLIPFALNLFFKIEDPTIEAIFNYGPLYGFIGFTMENFCFAMALAYRSKLQEIEKKELQEHYAEQLEKELTLRTFEIEQKSKELEDQKIKQLTINFEQQLQSSEMSALRAQMNPHFIFNCLNSIKLYTLENDSIAAAEFLTKFSRLIRLVLENSLSEKVLLATELETLQLYVEMETMRFKNRFKFELQLAESLDPEYTEVPPMLIQPYIENAIWHGLMHKESQGTLILSLDQVNEHLLQVEITDNGIGRTRAAEYKSKSATRHKSFGMKMNSERIALINQLHQNNTHVQILDLVDTNGSAAGTKVILSIPL